jgi:hypothetical protein
MSRLRNSKGWRRFCVIVAGLVLASAWLAAINALNAGEPWVGRNAWHLPLDTGGQLIALSVATALAIYQLARNHRWWL